MLPAAGEGGREGGEGADWGWGGGEEKPGRGTRNWPVTAPNQASPLSLVFICYQILYALAPSLSLSLFFLVCPKKPCLICAEKTRRDGGEKQTKRHK